MWEMQGVAPALKFPMGQPSPCCKCSKLCSLVLPSSVFCPVPASVGLESTVTVNLCLRGCCLGPPPPASILLCKLPSTSYSASSLPLESLLLPRQTLPKAPARLHNHRVPDRGRQTTPRVCSHTSGHICQWRPTYRRPCSIASEPQRSSKDQQMGSQLGEL